MTGAGGSKSGSDDGDREYIERLVSLPSEHVEWIVFRTAVTPQLRRRMRRLLLKGRLGAVDDAPPWCRLSGVERDALAVNADELANLVREAVVLALHRFEERQRAGGGWEHGAGRSLESYLTHGAVQAMRDVLRRWRRERAERDRERPAPPEDLRQTAGTHLWPAAIPRDPAEMVVADEELQRILEATRADDLLHRAVAERLQTGCSWIEVAVALGCSVKKIEKRLQRFRRNWGPPS